MREFTVRVVLDGKCQNPLVVLADYFLVEDGTLKFFRNQTAVAASACVATFAPGFWALASIEKL